MTIADAYGDTAAIAVLVGPPAGVVPADVTLDLAGNVSPQFASARTQAAIAQAAQLQPGATVSLGALAVGALPPGSAADARVNVVLHGNDASVDVTGATNVHVRVASLPLLDPAVLFYSDDPERLGPLDDGVLFRGTIDATRPARAYAYHVSDATGRKLYLALRAVGGNVARAGARCGGRPDGRVLVRRAPFDAALPARARAAGELHRNGCARRAVSAAARRGHDAAGTAHRRDLRPARARRRPVDVAIVAASTGVDPATLLGQPEHPSDGHFRRGEFSLANVPPLALAFTVGGPEPQPFTVGFRYFANGQPAFANLRPDINAAAGQRAPLAGDYGVLRNVSLQLANPTPAPQNVYLYEQPGANGGVTTTIWFTGDPAPTPSSASAIPRSAIS